MATFFRWHRRAPHPKTVYVRSYTRRRFGKQESVCAHFRSVPTQLQLDF